jgi:hypothetical protein
MIIMVDEETQRDSIFSSNKGNERRSLSKIEIVSIRILERWDEAINTFQLWKESSVARTSNEERLRFKIFAVLYALFIMNERLFFRKLDPKKSTYEDMKTMIMSSETDSKKLEDCFFIMNKVFDDLGLVKVDLERNRDTLEELNKKKGFD